jgi:hypothetical protein
MRWRGLVVMLVALASSCNAANVLEHTAEARQLATTLQTEFARAVEASNRAVMADSDSASSQSTREVEGSRERVKSTDRRLDALLRELQYPEEQKLLGEFHGEFAAYEALDASIVQLALEKTNLKARQLSFGPAREAADAFKEAMLQLPNAGGGTARGLVLEAVLAVRELQTLQPPHIAEPNDVAMTRLEERMAALEATARAALRKLASSVTPADLQAAVSALDRFVQTNAEIVALSRRNTNVRSLELTLGQKRKIVAACEESLHAIHEALVERARRPTR